MHIRRLNPLPAEGIFRGVPGMFDVLTDALQDYLKFPTGCYNLKVGTDGDLYIIKFSP